MSASCERCVQLERERDAACSQVAALAARVQTTGTDECPHAFIERYECPICYHDDKRVAPGLWARAESVRDERDEWISRLVTCESERDEARAQLAAALEHGLAACESERRATTAVDEARVRARSIAGVAGAVALTEIVRDLAATCPALFDSDGAFVSACALCGHTQEGDDAGKHHERCVWLRAKEMQR